jgi:hypothetical protein
MGKELWNSFKEAALSIVPIFVLVLIITFAARGLGSTAFYIDDPKIFGNGWGPGIASFVISLPLLVVGMTLFNLGAEKSMGKIGEIVGTTLTKRKSLFLLLFIGFMMGTLTTLAEPDLSVLSQRLSPGGNTNWLFVVVVACGVGLMMVVGIVRVVLQKSLKYWLIITYGLVFALGCLADKNFFSIVVDSSGVTTGPVSVPFIIALGIGVASVRGGKNAENDSFGFSGLCSLGPLLTMMVMGIILENNGGLSTLGINISTEVKNMADSGLTSFEQIGTSYISELGASALQVLISISPIAIFFFIYDIFLKLNHRTLISILIGMVYTYVGLVLFFAAANAGFIPLAMSLGTSFARMNNLPLFLLFGAGIGFIIILAEPAVHVLADQVAEVSRGVITRTTIFVALCTSTALSVILNILRVVFEIPIFYFIVPIYVVAFALCFFVDDIYVAIAIDSSGVATGTLSSCFLLPMFIGYTNFVYSGIDDVAQKGEKLMENGFGIIGLVSTTPFLAIEVVGLIAKLKTKAVYRKALEHVLEPDDRQVVHLPSLKQQEA